MKAFRCDRCGQVLFFESTQCRQCGAKVGFAPELMTLRAFNGAGPWRPCRNYREQHVCNWLLRDSSEAQLCRSCELTAVVPDLEDPAHHALWAKLESAKRRLVYSLLTLDLPLVARSQDAQAGLEFHFRSDAGLPPGEGVVTGHDNGTITVSLAEADDAERERRRVQLHEPYRTLLGHLRHESGHYYWDRLIRDDPRRLPDFRALFGDERQDYAGALDAHYAGGSRPGWQEGFISPYATAHPWEDWAETWAHYLHMVDGLETAAACGLTLSPPRGRTPALRSPASRPKRASFAKLQKDWIALTWALNSLNRSMGLNDAYPFVLSAPALQKLEFVHDVVTRR